MLGKTFFLAMIFGASLWLFLPLGAAKPKPEPLELQALLSPGQFFSTKRERIRLSYLEVPEGELLDHTNSCYQAQLHDFMEAVVLHQPLKIVWSQPYLSTQVYREGQIILAHKQDLGESLLLQGWASLTSVEAPESYRQAQAAAQSHKRGLWGACDNWYRLREKKRLQGKTQFTPFTAEPYLDSGAVGWVQKVLAPNVILLQNGQKVRLQGLSVPISASALKSCWEQQTIAYLTNLLLGQKVILQGDQIQFDKRGRTLARYLVLPSHRWQSSTLLNAHLIEQGYFLLDSEELNLRFLEEFKTAQAKLVSNPDPPDWMQQCIPSLTAPIKQNPGKAVDTTCPVKGNVSGSKANPKKTFHTADSPWYQRLKAEACFTSENEAITAGFTKVR